MDEYIAPGWRQNLTEQGLCNFNALWRLELKPLDLPNEDRGGWSVVSLLVLKSTDGQKRRLIIKRQQGHTSHTLRHPFRGVPTFETEFYNILRYTRLGIPTIEPVYYSRRNSPSGLQAVLVTEYLDGYVSLNELGTTWQDQGQPNNGERIRVIKAIASILSKLHSKGLQHNCVYPKHLFIRKEKYDIQVRLIDLENTRWRPFGNGRRIRDLESLFRHAKGWSNTDRLRFFKDYCDIEHIDKNTSRLCRQIIKRNKRKLGQ
jgi:hypothetical protein